jgi:hypothetical protein
MKRLIAALSFALFAVSAIAADVPSESKESPFSQQHDFIAPAQ